MRTIAHSLPLLALAIGCPTADPVDPATALQEFATFNADDLYSAIWAEVSVSHELWNPVEYTVIDGDFVLSGVGGSASEIDVTYSLDLQEGETFEGENVYAWTMELDYLGVQLPSCIVDGSGTWIVEHAYYDYNNIEHSWDGQLGLDDADPQQVSYEAFFSGNLHWLTGSIGDTEVDWENDNPDLP